MFAWLRSDAESFDFSSLSLENPRFTFFHAQEFFIARDAACNARLEHVKPEPVPVNARAKRAQLQQRFVVKNIKESLVAASKQDSAKARQVRDVFLSERGATEPVPAVEFHMFPQNPQQVNSTWMALFIPRAKEIFGQTLYLCQENLETLEAFEAHCVARLPFERLPPRLIHYIGQWSSSTDPKRSAPHKLVLFMEVLLLGVAVFVLFQFLDSSYKLLKISWKQYFAVADDLAKQRLRDMPLPRTLVLTQHAYVYRAEGGGDQVQAEPLHACHKVTVLQVAESSPERRGLAAEMLHLAFHSRETAVWGCLQDPVGWVVLANGARDIRVIAEGEDSAALFCANDALLVPFTALLRRQLVLAASHTSVQWFLLDRLAHMFGISEIVAISISLCVVHVAVLCHMETVNSQALRYDQVLEFHSKLLPLHQSRLLHVVLLGALFTSSVAVCVGLVRKRAPISASPPCVSLLVTVALHLCDYYMSREGLEKWRSPQLRIAEFTRISCKGLEVAREGVEKPELTAGRDFRHHCSRLLLWLYTMGALGLLMLIVLDGVKMQGELLDYSFSRGYVATPPHSQAMHNTVLLHSSVDTVSFAYEPGPFTSRIEMCLEHPLMEAKQVTLFDADDSGSEMQGDYAISLPASPLYSRLIVQATSHLLERPTEYVFHFVRVGEAVVLSINGTVNPEHFAADMAPVHFHERRRWQYHVSHPTWFVPDLQMTVNSSLQVEYLPIIFAPLLAHQPGETEMESLAGLSMLAGTCHCEPEEPGFGNACAFELPITLPNGSTTCIFQHGVKRRLLLEDFSSGSLSNGTRLAKWLLNVDLSGKSVELELIDPVNSSESSQLLEAIRLEANASSSPLANVFRLSVPTAVLITQAAQLVIKATQDMTDAESLAAPLRVVSHPPPIHLSISNISSRGFMLPDPSTSEDRADFAGCLLPDLGLVEGSVLDSRFVVEVKEVSRGPDCSGEGALKHKQFSAVRRPSKHCDPYCSFYRAWTDRNYDVSVVLSIGACFNQAIELNNLRALHEEAEEVGGYSPAIFGRCGTLHRAIQLGRNLIASEMLGPLHANPDGGHEAGQTPLQVAAEMGDIDSMELLLHYNASVNHTSKDGSTALFTAALNCRADAVKFLLKHKGDPNHLLKENSRTTCHVTPLLALFSYRRSQRCQGGNLTSVIRTLFDGGAALSVDVGCGTKTALAAALGLAAESGDLTEVELLLKLGADANATSSFRHEAKTPFMLAFDRTRQKPARFKQMAELLVHYKADVDVNMKSRKKVTALMLSAKLCEQDLVQTLVQLKADPNRVEDKSFANKCENKEEIRQLLRNDTLST